MNALVTKEIRLLLPGYAMALLLAVVPVWLLSDVKLGVEHTAPILAPLLFGVLVLALSSFGREFGMNTFPLLLAQPLTRSRIWWTKVVVLALAMATVFGASLLSLASWRIAHR